MEQMRNAYNFLAGRPAGKRPIGISGCRWEDNIKLKLRKIRSEVLD
jgi:hypothetical protein